jgi:uncharacterized CHY-type Zn-finger protein
MITNVVGIKCDHCGKIATYDASGKQHNAIEVLNLAERYGWQWTDRDESICPHCVENMPNLNAWSDYKASVTQ